jgi:hypothetical protein
MYMLALRYATHRTASRTGTYPSSQAVTGDPERRHRTAMPIPRCWPYTTARDAHGTKHHPRAPSKQAAETNTTANNTTPINDQPRKMRLARLRATLPAVEGERMAAMDALGLTDDHVTTPSEARQMRYYDPRVDYGVPPEPFQGG